MPCTTACVQPSPSQAHCGSCHITWSGPTLFDAHRRGLVDERTCTPPEEMTDRGLPLRNASGVWRSSAARPTTGSVAPQTAEPPMVGASGRLRPVEAKSGTCCADHNRHCEPPSELCCHSCPEIAHDMFPIRHGDGSPCVLDRPAHPIADGGIGASIVILGEPGGAA